MKSANNVTLFKLQFNLTGFVFFLVKIFQSFLHHRRTCYYSINRNFYLLFLAILCIGLGNNKRKTMALIGHKRPVNKI